MKLPSLLDPSRENAAVDVLRCYYGVGRHASHRSFTGARFDTWDSTGTRAADTDVFTADDLVAVTFLSVSVPPRAAIALLDDMRAELTDLLKAVNADRDLVTEEVPWDHDWVGWKLFKRLQVPGIGPTTASKLFARKRPRLRPIYDTVVKAVTGAPNIWEPLRAQLQDDPTLHGRLIDLRSDSGVPNDVSAIRVFDVIAWMEGKGNTSCPRA